MTPLHRTIPRGGAVLLIALGTLCALHSAVSVAASSALAPAGASSERVTVIYLLRHAEKEKSTDPDPELTPQGRRRALQLADQLDDEPITHIYSSEYRRTLETVSPLAHRLGLEIERYDARDSEALVERVLVEAEGGTAVISGHSNTVPGLVNLFGHPEQFDLHDSDYGDLFRLRIDAGKVEMTRLRFGD